ncbi:MAG: type II toxin-antitoxin system HicB family antitoxin [Deltaproteobacteria bacterium]|nr:type II toxin-antitoxin system HicB family antitoxin [Deltaproteobacteria bacterium]
MIRQYIATAMNHAKYEMLADDNSYYGEISLCPGVYANKDNLEECRNELEEILEEWILFRVYRQLPIPEIDGMKVEVRKAQAA